MSPQSIKINFSTLNFKVFFCLTLFVFTSLIGRTQTYPTYGPEIPVTINGLTFDAMEPSISADNNTLFFNNLNDGIATSLFYATRMNDSIFTYQGPLTGANQTITPRLDAVASSDSSQKFFWTTLRDFPTQFHNFMHGQFNGNNVVNIGRVHGSFYIDTIGWLMMDASINYSGDQLYYTNAYFGPTYNSCGSVPCLGKLGVAQKVNDTIFNKLSNSDLWMQSINDTNYVVYAPHISKNGLELYYTRFLKSNLFLGTEICVSVRNNVTDVFSPPSVLHPLSTLVPEAPSLSTDQNKLYYHKKINGTYRLFMQYRNFPAQITEALQKEKLVLYPNPSNSMVYLQIPLEKLVGVQILSQTGQVIQQFSTSHFSVAELSSGVYWVLTKTTENNYINKLIIP